MDQVTINIIKNDMGEEITIYDIDRTHCLGKHKLDNNVPWPIIVKFEGTMFAVGFSQLKKKLKGKNVSITESLTKRRVIKIKKAKKKMYNSHDGKIVVLDINERNKVKVFYD